jgi:hypothetical protein
MTAFIESFATQHLPPPWKAAEARTWAFPFSLSTVVIQNYLDRFFNVANPNTALFRLKAMEPIGILTISNFPKIETDETSKFSTHYQNLASRLDVAQTQVSVDVPVRCVRKQGDEREGAPEILWFQPFAISDNETVVFASREILGADMMLGRIELDMQAAPSGVRLHTHIPAIRRFGPRSKEEWLGFLHVDTGSETKSYVPFRAPKMAAWVDRFGGGANASKSNGLSDPMTARMVALKQFRDTQKWDEATYQAIVACTVTHSDLRDVRFFDPAAVKITFTDSATAAEILCTFLDLGTPSDGSTDPESKWERQSPVFIGPVELLGAFTFTSSATINAIETLHTFGSGR